MVQGSNVEFNLLRDAALGDQVQPLPGAGFPGVSRSVAGGWRGSVDALKLPAPHSWKTLASQMQIVLGLFG